MVYNCNIARNEFFKLKIIRQINSQSYTLKLETGSAVILNFGPDLRSHLKFLFFFMDKPKCPICGVVYAQSFLPYHLANKHADCNLDQVNKGARN